MNWRDQLQEASFRGVKFYVDSREYRFGRKNIFHDFPFRDDSELEDQGASTDVFSIDAYILQRFVGNRQGPNPFDPALPEFDYIGDRNALIQALKTKGPGKLVDRYGLGEKNVALDGEASMSETFTNGGIARFRMTFKEIGLSRAPDTVVDPVAYMDAVAYESTQIVYDDFVGEIDILADLQKLANTINGAMTAITSKIRELKSLPGSVIAMATSIITAATNLIDEVLSTPCDLINGINGAFDSFLFAAGMLGDSVSRDILGPCSGRVQNPEDAERNSDELSIEEGTSISTAAASLSTFGEDLPVINVISQSSAKDLANRQASVNSIRSFALITACRIAVRTTFTSQEEAQALLLTITELIEAYLEYLGDEAGDSTLPDKGIVYSNDETFQAMKALIPALKKSMDTIGASLAKTVEYTVGTEALSTLTLAYDRYEDLDRNTEILDRNKTLILNPCFIPNGKTIDILSE